jgi:hypothetical protein
MHRRMSSLRVWRYAAVALAVVCCGAKPYEFGSFPAWHDTDRPTGDISIEYGKPRKRLDQIGWIVGIPSRILPMNSKINNHHLSEETIGKLRDYLVRNDLSDVSVYVNDYDPKGQWRHLKANKRVGAGWRYTFGLFSLATYTILPGRIFGGDNYNPYTNTLSLHSDVPALVLRESAFAKCVHGHKRPGFYAMVDDLPVASLLVDVQAARDVFAYARMEHDWPIEKQAYHVLYPQMGIDIMTAGTPFISSWWAGPVLGFGGAIAGHATGHVMAARREKRLAAEPPSEVRLATHLEPLEPVPDGALCPWFDSAAGTWNELLWQGDGVEPGFSELSNRL